jgi:hypothetical protein
VNREVRVGVTHAYVVFVQILGNVWLERNVTTLLAHVLDLVANPKAASSHVDAVYSRKYVHAVMHVSEVVQSTVLVGKVIIKAQAVLLRCG